MTDLDSDRKWQLAALRGDYTTEAALDYVRNARTTRPTWEHGDPAAARALDEGDARYPDDDRRWPTPEPPIETDPETTAEFARRNGEHPGVTLVAAASVRVDRPVWTWDRRIPVGGTTLMPGREGLGKTALCCWSMARLTRGQLHGHWWGRPADVVYIGTEDDRATVLVPRLIAAGADLDRVHFVDIPGGLTFSVGVDTPMLAKALAGHDVALVVVDPLDGHLHGIDTHKKADVQQAVAKLAQLAQDIRCGALGLAHLNKGDTRDLLSRVVGSVGFTTSVRSVLGVGEHPDQPTERVCVLAKANMTDRTTVPALRFKVEGTEIPHPDGGDPIDTGIAVILGEELGLDPDSVIDRGTPAERTALEEAVDWLNDVLGDGPVDSADIKKWAKAADISERTLHRARAKAGVKVSRRQSERGRPTVWEIAGFHASGYMPTSDGTNSAPPLTRDNTTHGEGFVSTPEDGTEPWDEEF